jgi:sporulation protein YlmC with PRC-barrel domain
MLPDGPGMRDLLKCHYGNTSTIVGPLSDHPINSRSSLTMTDTTMSNVISSDKVEGTAVYNSGGDKLGSIDDLMIDKSAGQVRYAVMEFGGFLGMGTDRYPIPWKMLKYDTKLDGYVVPLDKNKLEKAPKYGMDDVPAYDRAYGDRINGYYGVTW